MVVNLTKELPAASEEISSPFRRTAGLRQENLLAANAWKASDIATLRQSAVKRQEPITSLGYDGPLASLSSQRQNIADFFKEQVAVVTNPAIDREREMEHFSTRVMLGPRPVLRRNSHDNVVLEIPFLTGGRREEKTTTDREVSREAGTCSLEDLLGFFSSGRGRYRILSCALRSGENVPDSLERLRKEALSAVSRGCWLLLLTTAQLYRHCIILDGTRCIVVHRALAGQTRQEGLRRRTSLVVRSEHYNSTTWHSTSPGRCALPVSHVELADGETVLPTFWQY
jgi:glutamate synthase (NADPH/NADH) large chain